MEARILIVDDDVALLEALPRALRLRLDGVEIDTVDNAGDALIRIIGTDYDAIVSDIKMPGMDGLAVLEEIRKLRPKTPTLLITGLPPHEVIEKPVGSILPGRQTIAGLVPVSHVPGPESASAKTLPVELDGKELWLSISGVRFDDGVVYAFRDVTEERALEELKGEFVATISHEL